MARWASQIAWEPLYPQYLSEKYNLTKVLSSNPIQQLHHEYYPPPPPPSGAQHGMTPTVGGLNTSSDSGSSGSSGNNNTKLNPAAVSEQPGDQKRTVNFKLEIKQDPEKIVPDMCKPQKVPSISDLSETESSLDLPTHQVRE